MSTIKFLFFRGASILYAFRSYPLSRSFTACLFRQLYTSGDEPLFLPY